MEQRNKKRDLTLLTAQVSVLLGLIGVLSLILLWTRICPCPKTRFGMFLLFNWLIVGPAGAITGIVTLKRIGNHKDFTKARYYALAGLLFGILPLIVFGIVAYK